MYRFFPWAGSFAKLNTQNKKLAHVVLEENECKWSVSAAWTSKLAANASVLFTLVLHWRLLASVERETGTQMKLRGMLTLNLSLPWWPSKQARRAFLSWQSRQEAYVKQVCEPIGGCTIASEASSFPSASVSNSPGQPTSDGQNSQGKVGGLEVSKNNNINN